MSHLKPESEFVSQSIEKQLIVTSFGETAYTSSGKGQTTIIELPGWPVTGDVFAPANRVLARKARTLALDLPGIGRSTPLRADVACNFTVLGQWLLEFMNAQGIDKASFAGTSFGAALSIHFGLQHPERVDKIVATAPPIRFGDEVNAFQRFILDLTQQHPALSHLIIDQALKSNRLIYFF